MEYGKKFDTIMFIIMMTVCCVIFITTAVLTENKRQLRQRAITVGAAQYTTDSGQFMWTDSTGKFIITGEKE